MRSINYGLIQQPKQGASSAISQGLALGHQIKTNRERKEYRSALGVLATEPENQEALARVFEHNPNVALALHDRADDMRFGRDAASMVGGQHNAIMPLPPENQSRQEDPLAFLGAPRNADDQAFLRMVRTDPERALKFRGQMRDNLLSRIRDESDFYGLAIGELSRATDQGSWIEGLKAIAPRAREMGANIMRYVPSKYPGPDGVRALMERAQPVKDQLDRMIREANIDADNARADRNADSLIETREGRLAEYERHNRASESNQRRGQDMTDARVRSGRRPRRVSDRESGGDDLPTFDTPQEAMASGLPSGTRFRTPDGRVKVKP